MRLIYWMNDWLHYLSVCVGDWALRKSHRPHIVLAVTVLVIHLIAWAGLGAMEAAFRHP